MVCAAPKRLLHTARAEEPQHIVAGERFHWSREEWRFQRERFSRAWFTPVSHRTRKQSRGSAEAARMQSGSSACPLCFHSPRQHEREGAQRTEHNWGFGFQTKVKDRFLNQRRWTCWYSCRKKHASPVSDSQFSYTFLFVFVLKSLLSLLFTSRYAMEAFLIFLILLLFDSSVFAKHSVMY